MPGTSCKAPHNTMLMAFSIYTLLGTVQEKLSRVTVGAIMATVAQYGCRHTKLNLHNRVPCKQVGRALIPDKK
jgi:hypothetical protein